MGRSTVTNDHSRRDVAAVDTFLESPNEESFTELFLTFTPQLVSFFRSHGCRKDSSEDLSQEVMLTVYRKAGQLRDHARFRSWLFTIGRHLLYRHRGQQLPEADCVDWEGMIDTRTKRDWPPMLEFQQWMSFLKPCEREALTFRFVEEWEYHEIASARAVPMGTAQWRVFNAKKKLAAHLTAPRIPRAEVA
jgi:RNA polymerase sigma-70 factor (ECF subfamily)